MQDPAKGCCIRKKQRESVGSALLSPTTADSSSFLFFRGRKGTSSHEAAECRAVPGMGSRAAEAIPSGAGFMETLGFSQLPVVACSALGKRLQPGAFGCCSSVDSCRD